MSKFNYACQFLTLEDGSPIIKCRDLPELLSWPMENETSEEWARYAVEDCIEFRMRDGEIIPEASEAKEDEYVVELTQELIEKILQHNEKVQAAQ